MSSIEGLIAEITTEFAELHAFISSTCKKSDASLLSVQEGTNIFSRLVRFQRFLEARERMIDAYRSTVYYKRASDKYDDILAVFRSEDLLPPPYEGDNLTEIARAVISHCRKGAAWQADIHNALEDVESKLELMELDLIELYADLRLLNEMISIPLEQRMILKEQLIRASFDKTENFIEDAEKNLASTPPHLKDVLSNCRDAVEAMIYELLEREGLTPQKRFTNDLIALSDHNPKLIDAAMVRSIQGVYGFLSLTGSHAFSKNDSQSMPDVEYGLNQTYTLLSRILQLCKK